MFKNIFSKYLMTFTVILFCCILAIILAVSSRTANESFLIKRDTMNTSVGSTAILIETYLDENGYSSIYKAFESNGDLQITVNSLAENSKTNIYVFDSSGALVGTSDQDYQGQRLTLSSNARITMLNSAESYSISTVDGFFGSTRLNSYTVSYSHGKPFIVLSSIENYNTLVFDRDIIMVSVTVGLWVFLAAMISLYVISRRTTEPLSEIVTAAKSYAKGRFEQKIEVVGQDEVSELAKAINDMSVSLKRIEDERNSFLGNVSHDLRTPMTTISGFVDGILDGTIPPEKQEYYLNIVSQEIKRLSRLVNTLLEVSRMESGANLKPIDFNLSETARTVLISLESKISDKNIDINFDSGEEDVFVEADPDAIHRVIFNLMDNAVKFTHQDGNISITVTTVADGRKKRKALFKIKNTGDGIPKDELPHIFERFYKTDRSRGLDKSGKGLGLYIAKTAIQHHGEELTVDSVQGEYTEFCFNLPLSQKEMPIRRNI